MDWTAWGVEPPSVCQSLSCASWAKTGRCFAGTVLLVHGGKTTKDTLSIGDTISRSNLCPDWDQKGAGFNVRVSLFCSFHYLLSQPNQEHNGAGAGFSTVSELPAGPDELAIVGSWKTWTLGDPAYGGVEKK